MMCKKYLRLPTCRNGFFPGVVFLHLLRLLVKFYLVFVQPKLMTCDLLHLVTSRYMLKEKHLFGLAFKDDL